MKIKIIILFIFLINSFTVQNSYIPMKEYNLFEIEKVIFYKNIKNKPFSEELLRQCLYYEQVKYPEVVILQAILETGFYKSDIFLNGNNLFGMKYPKYRSTVAIGTYKGHSQYEHWSDSVIDYKIWQEWYLSLGWRIDIQQDYTFYMLFLKEMGYAEDPLYIPKLIKLKANKDIT